MAMTKEYIEREAAIAFMNEVEPCICHDPDGAVFTATKDSNMLEFLRAIPAADVRPVKWIPVTERLPEDGDNVIVCTKSGNVGEAKYQAALGYDLNYPEIWFLLNDYGNQYQTGEIIAWMPLPQAPKEKT